MQMKVTRAGGVNVRLRPNTDSDVVEYLLQGEIIEAKPSSSPKWYSVYIENFGIAYVIAESLEKVPEVDRLPAGNVRYAKPPFLPDYPFMMLIPVALVGAYFLFRD